MNRDRAAVEEALEAFLIELANLADESETRPDGVSDRDRGLAYLGRLADPSDIAWMSITPARFSDGGPFATIELHRAKAARGALYALAAALGVAGGATGLCTICAKSSARRYCDDCALDRNIESYENPAHVR